MTPYATKTSSDETITLSTPDGSVTLYYPGANLPQSITSLASSASSSQTTTSPSNPATQSASSSSSSSGVPAPGKRTLGLPVDDTYAMTTTIPPQSRFAVAPHWHESYTECFRVVSGYVLVRLGSKHFIYGPYSQYGQDATIPPYTIHGFSRADVSSPQCDAAWREFEKIHGTGIREGERAGWTGREAVMHEWTLPADGSKEVFFRNTMSWVRDNLAAAFASSESGGGGGGGGGGGKGSGVGVLMIVWLLVTRLPRVLYMVAFMDTFLLLLDNNNTNNSHGKTMSGSDGASKGGSQTKVGGYTGAGKEDRGPSTSSYYLTHGVMAVIKFIGGLMGWQVWRREYIPERLWGVADRMEKLGRK